MNVPRSHHTIPKSFLARFTEDYSVSGTLNVFDFEARKQFKSSPMNAARRRDYYRVDTEESEDAFKLERKFLHSIEDESKPILDIICSTKALPVSKDDFGQLLDFIAAQSARTPAFIENFSSQLAQVLQHVAYLKLSQPKEVLVARAKELGVTVSGQAIDKLRQEFANGGLRVEPSQNMKMDIFLSSLKEIRRILELRKWSVSFCQEDAPNLLCADRPVLIRNVAGPDFACGIWGGPSFGSVDTDLILPISRRILVVGRLVDHTSTSNEGAETQVLDYYDVASLNTELINNATRFIYYADDFVTVCDSDGAIFEWRF